MAEVTSTPAVDSASSQDLRSKEFTTMAKPGHIAADFDTVRKAYPTYNRLPKHIDDCMKSLNKNIPEGQPKNTPCCFQISEALNHAGTEHRIPQRSHRRANTDLNGDFFLGAVDELDYHLTARYGAGESLAHLGSRKAKEDAIRGRKGILCFRNSGAGTHTELWDGSDIVQNGAPASNGAAMSKDHIWGQPKVLFWEFDGDDGVDPVPSWLQGWWDVNDGNQWYYYFSEQYVVHWTKKKPTGPFALPERLAGNEGRVDLSTPGRVVLTWKPSGDGITQETFTPIGQGTGVMGGTSNRFAPLSARRLVF
jgi:hypothetical protein